MKVKMIEITNSEWVKQYEPFLESFTSPEEVCLKDNPNTIWTEYSCGDASWIESGVGYVNRVRHFLTNKTFSENTYVSLDDRVNGRVIKVWQED
jgi:hypothetical protein